MQACGARIWPSGYGKENVAPVDALNAIESNAHDSGAVERRVEHHCVQQGPFDLRDFVLHGSGF
jgi:hypothetical protein